jgi:hypothetical protein
LQSARDRPAIRTQIAIASPIKNNTKPITAKIQPRNSGGNSSPGFAVPCRAANMKIVPTVVYSSGEKGEERGQAGDNVMKNREQP